MTNKKLIDRIEFIAIILLIIFGLFIAYQIILKIFGGSWATEDIIVALLVFVIGFVFTIALNLVKLNLKHDHLEKQFFHLAKDFKEQLSYKYKKETKKVKK
jgi:uncharacterized integral membrane protein